MRSIKAILESCPPPNPILGSLERVLRKAKDCPSPDGFPIKPDQLEMVAGAVISTTGMEDRSCFYFST